jgi:3-oxoacyl-(acyl-carrier-protein) synthase
MCKLYVNGAAAVSVQDSFNQPFTGEFIRHQQLFVPAVEPPFAHYISPVAARRMSRIIKRAVCVSQLALDQAGISCPDGIIFGTGLGCIEDTEKFLSAMIAQEEQLMQPAFFVQSTHNTIAAQVAIRLACHGYNNTHMQRRLSFESALMDAQAVMLQHQAQSILVGGHDELTPKYFQLLHKAGYYSFDSQTGKGSFAGEGSCAFVLSQRPSAQSYAVLEGLSLRYTGLERPSVEALALPFLQALGVAPEAVGSLVTAYTDDAEGAAPYATLAQSALSGAQHLPFKALCGEYFTASAFGFWLAVHYLRHQNPSETSARPYILLHNHSQGKHHSLILLRHV